jgi:hypothetical protein
MVTFDLEADAYRVARDEGMSLSNEAKRALGTAVRAMRMNRRTVVCAGPVAAELQDWFRDHERGYLSMKGHAYKSPWCRKAANAIDATIT